MKPVQFFDFDGVIFDSRADVFQMWREVFASKGIDFTLDKFYEKFCGDGWTKTLEMGITLEDQEHFSKIEWERFGNPEKVLDIFPFSKEIMEALSKKYQLYFFSNNQTRVLEFVFDHYDLTQFVTYIDGRHDSGKTKLDRVRECIESQKIDTSHSWFVTDTVGDIEVAKNIGLKSLAVTWGYHPLEYLQKAKPTQIINRPKEILEIL